MTPARCGVPAQAIFGHVHAYARHYPAFDEKAFTGEDAYTDPPATVHFTAGAAGNPEMAVGDVPPPLGKCRRVAPRRRCGRGCVAC